MYSNILLFIIFSFLSFKHRFIILCLFFFLFAKIPGRFIKSQKNSSSTLTLSPLIFIQIKCLYGFNINLSLKPFNMVLTLTGRTAYLLLHILPLIVVDCLCIRASPRFSCLRLHVQWVILKHFKTPAKSLSYASTNQKAKKLSIFFNFQIYAQVPNQISLSKV